ncbi:hypothetical protein ACHAW5_010642 [Stephanodiscus triporus]|uniref:Phosphoglycerate mutase-like protein n=1 Tax=Stephanodiscus triporus TaxID=2934178 RepID=A0ABD3QD58_9STRA
MNAKSPKRSQPTVKTITLIRHGVAYHNVRDAQTGETPNYLDPKLTDPPLVRQGEIQARALGDQLKRMGMIGHRGGSMDDICSLSAAGGGALNADVVDGDDGGQDKIQLVVSSPLTRCLQTASLIFPTYFASSHPSPAVTCGALAMEGDNEVHVLDRNVVCCCHGDLREAYGIHYPDKRGPLSRLKSSFPTVHYHPSLTENDDDWRPDNRETRGDVSRRIKNFFVWLMKQPHSNVAIVTHGVWMECALMNYCPEALEFGTKRVFNCDVYSGKLIRSSDQDGVVLRDVKKVAFHFV